MRALPAAALLSAFGILSRVLGVLRDRLLTSTFGAGPETDAFLAANRVPDLLYQILVLGAIASVLIPTYTTVRAKDASAARTLASNVLVVVGGALIVAAALAGFFAPTLARVVGSGFTESQLALTATLMRVQLLAPLFLGLSSVTSALLQAHGTFWTFAVAPVLYNIGQLSGIWFLSSAYGIRGAAIGVAAGALLHLLIQLPSFARRVPIAAAHAPLGDPALRTMLRQAGPRILALSASQLDLLVETTLASLLAAGSITVLAYAQNLMSFPLGVFGIPIAIAAFPQFSTHHAAGDHAAFRTALQRAFRQTLFWILPASFGLILLRHDIVATLFLSARFSEVDVARTADTLAVFSLALVAHALLPIAARAFYAAHNTWRPVLAALSGIIVHASIALLAVFVFRLPVWGLAAAFTLASVVNLTLHLVWLHRVAGHGWARGMGSAIARTLALSGAMALVVVCMQLLLAQFPLEGWWGSAVRLAVAGSIGALVYLLLSERWNPAVAREVHTWRTRAREE